MMIVSLVLLIALLCYLVCRWLEIRLYSHLSSQRYIFALSDLRHRYLLYFLFPLRSLCIFFSRLRIAMMFSVSEMMSSCSPRKKRRTAPRVVAWEIAHHGAGLGPLKESEDITFSRSLTSSLHSLSLYCFIVLVCRWLVLVVATHGVGACIAPSPHGRPRGVLNP